MRCKYCLLSVNFNNSYTDACYFKDRATQILELKGDKPFISDFNFDYGNILYSNCVVNEYNNENYIIIQNEEGDTYFYFITNAYYYSVNQWRLTLEIDVINTYMLLNNYHKIPDCMIERAHVDRMYRYKDNDGYKGRFIISRESNTIIPEQKFTYYTTKRNTVKIRYYKNDEINDWLNDNILCWRLIFVDSSHKYNFYAHYNYSSGDRTYSYSIPKSYTYAGSVINDDYSLICEPVYKTVGKKIYFIGSGEDEDQKITFDGFEDFRKENENNYIYNIKYTTCCPFKFSDIIPDDAIVSINKDNLYIQYERNNEIYDGVIFVGFRFDNISFSIRFTNQVDLNLTKQKAIICGFGSTNKDLDNVISSYRYEFPISEIKGVASEEFEPKILLDCKRLTLRDSANGEYNYNGLYIGTNVLKPLYNEMNNITNNNYYYRLKSEGIIPDSDIKNWSGVVNTVDYSQQIANDTYNTFISNNKNFQLMKTLGYVGSFAASAFTANVPEMITSGTGIANDLIRTALELDNINNKANSLRNVSGTFTLNFKVNDGLHLYIDEESANEVEIRKYYRYLYNYGYIINKIGRPVDFVNTRKYFNYLKCDIESINMEIPNVCEEKLKEVFKNGVRLWNGYSNMYNYVNENYEVIFDD